MIPRLILSLLILTLSLGIFAEEPKDPGSSGDSNVSANKAPQLEVGRRTFLGGLFGVGVVAALPGGIAAKAASLGRTKIPPDILKEIAKRRIRILDQVAKTGGTGLRAYMSELRRIHTKVSSDALKNLLQKRITMAEQTLENVQWLRAEKATSAKGQGANAEQVRTREEWSRVNDFKRKMYSDYIDMPLDLKILTLRALMDPELLRKMSWQWEKLNLLKEHYPEILTVKDVKLLKEYRKILASFRSEAKGSPFAHQILEQTLKEVEVSLYSYKHVRRYQSNILRCRKIF